MQGLVVDITVNFSIQSASELPIAYTFIIKILYVGITGRDDHSVYHSCTLTGMACCWPYGAVKIACDARSCTNPDDKHFSSLNGTGYAYRYDWVVYVTAFGREGRVSHD
jgi:hypothetical protein